jgi:hypothetical protein
MGTIARYNTTSGLAGCYMPDNIGGPVCFTRRKDLADHIRYELSFLEWPASCIKQVKLERLWSFIKRHGSSTAHFSIHYKQFVLEFHGLTEAEFEQQEVAQ